MDAAIHRPKGFALYNRLEQCGSSSSTLPMAPGTPFSIQPVILDTNIFLRDMAYSVRKGRTTNLVLVSSFGSLRLFVARHVIDEVEEKLAGFMRGRKLDEQRAWETWRTVYRPLLRVVDVPTDIEDGRVAHVRSIDLDDVPTARLSVLIAPCNALSADKALINAGLTSVEGPEYLAFVQHGKVAADGDQALLGVETLAALSLTALNSAGSAIVRSGWGPTVVALLAGASLILWQQGVMSRDRVGQLAARVGPIATHIGATLDHYMAARESLMASYVQSIGTPDLRSEIARFLASAPQPCSGTQIARVLSTPSRAIQPRVVNDILRANPAFVQVRRYAWQLGHSQ